MFWGRGLEKKKDIQILRALPHRVKVMDKVLRITVDTNVFISMLLGSKNCQAIYETFVKGMVDLVISIELFDEINTVLKRDAFFKVVSAQDLRELLKATAE